MLGSDLPPPYSALKEDDSTEQSAANVTGAGSPDVHEIYGALFEQKDNRIAFIQKVLVIKLLQAFAVSIPMIVFQAEPYAIYMSMRYDRGSRNNMKVIASLVVVGVLILIHYCDKARFARPYNYMFLLAYPLSVAFFFSVITFDWMLVEGIICCIFFIFVLLALIIYSIFALQSKIDFKTSYCLIITPVILIAAYALTVPLVYGPFVSPFVLFYGAVATFALTAYMLVNLQAMMSKNYHMHLSPSDVVKAAVMMQIDYPYMIMRLFTKNEETRETTNADAAFSA